ncbi:MAG: hypothetical protein GKR89_19590 [Candidatus Latescibacteria bacterium]|nr:hypothetical protein [Candidatus Latescibacterota bacterium]
MIDLLLILLIILGLTACLSLLSRHWRQPQYLNCRFCRHNTLTSFESLPPEDQAHIADYCKNYERRTPNFPFIFICSSCQVVFDEYSNATKALFARMGGTRIKANSLCKVCFAVINDCALDRDDIHCHRCQTLHQWLPYKDRPAKFLQPPAEAQIRPIGIFTRARLR